MRVLAVAAGAGVRRALSDPGDAVVRLAFYVLILLAMNGLWHAGFARHGGKLGGYTLDQVLWYVMAAQASVAGVRPRLIEEIGDDIASGQMATAMLRPISVAGFRIAHDLGEAWTRMFQAAVVGTAVMWLLAGPPPSASGLGLALAALVLAVAVNVIAANAFGALAFWVMDARAAWFLYQKALFVLGGMLIPLEILPSPLAAVCRALPFSAMAWAPARLAAGAGGPGLLLIQLGWTLGLLLLTIGVFARGERRLTVVGA